MPSDGRDRLRSFHALAEPLCRSAKLELRVDVELARDVHRGEQHVAELVRSEVLLQLAQLVVEVGDGAREIRILEADRTRPHLHLLRVRQRRQPFGHVVEDPDAPLVVALQGSPSRSRTCSAVFASASPNTCGWRATSFV